MARNIRARNMRDGVCYICGIVVKAGTGQFELQNASENRWRLKHANYGGNGRITCKQAVLEDDKRKGQTG